jgi:hypothetical protein
MTLRILHLPNTSPKLRSIASYALTYVSPENEKQALETLKQVCEAVVSECEDGLEALQCLKEAVTAMSVDGKGRKRKKGKPVPAREVGERVDKLAAIATLEGLRREERAIARAALRGLAIGSVGGD